MKTFIILSKFFGGLILFFAIGWIFSHLLKLDKKYDEMQKERENKNKQK